MLTNDEVYFACKKAFQESQTTKETLAKLKEIFTPEVVLQMNADNEHFKTETRLMLNREHAKARREQKNMESIGKPRVRKFGPKKYKVDP